jgi:fibronectin-binding autotransporter adhesin
MNAGVAIQNRRPSCVFNRPAHPTGKSRYEPTLSNCDFAVFFITILITIMLALAPKAGAATRTKANNGDNLNLTTSWVGGIVPGSIDTALWDSTLNTFVAIPLGANLNWGQIRVTNLGVSSFTIQAGNTLTLSGVSGVGIDMSSATANFGFNCDIVLGGAQTWNIASGRTLNVLNATLNNGGNLLTINNAGTVAFSSLISGAGGLTKSGSGNLNPGLPLHAYTGVTTLDGGIFNATTLANVNTASSIGKGSVAGSAADLVFGGGTLSYLGSAANNTNRLFTIGDANGLIATLDSSSSTAANTMSFTSTGSIAFGGSGARTLTLTGTNTGNNTFAPILADGTGGATALTKAGAGTWVISGANTYSGDTTVSAGILRLGAANRIPDGAGKGNVSVSGTLDLNTFSETINGLSGAGTVDTIAGGTPTLTVGNNNATSSFSGVMKNTAGTLALTKTGSGTLTLLGTNTYTGGTNINGGILNLGVAQGGSGGPLGGSAVPPSTTIGIISFGGGTLQFSAANQTDYSSRFSSGATQAYSIDTNGQTVNWGTASSSTGGTLTKLGAGTLNITTTGNTWSGATTIDGGILKVAGLANINTNSSIGKGSVAGSAADLVFGGGTLQYTGSSATSTNRLFTIGDANALTATLDASGTGTGTISFISTGALGFGGSGARILTLTGTNTGNNTFAPSVANGTGGATSLIKSSTGTWALAGNNSYSGGTTLNAGQLNINSATALGTGTFTIAGVSVIDSTVSPFGPLTNNNAQNWNADFTFAGSNSLDLGNGAVSMSASRQVTVSANNLTVGGAISGSTFGLTKAGAGNLTLNGNSSYSGATTINAGTITVNKLADGGLNSSIGSSTNAASNLVINGGVLQYDSTNASSTNRLFTITTIGAEIWSNSSLSSNTVSFTNTAAVTVSGSGSRTLTLKGLNTGSNTLSPALVDPGSGKLNVVKDNLGKWILAGANTYTGTTTVNFGTLLVNGSTAAGSAVTVNNGGTLGGSGTVGGTVGVLNGGNLSPGNSTGILHTGALTLNAGSNLLLEVASGSGPTGTGAGTIYDQVAVTGTILLAGNLAVTATTTLNIGDKYFIALNDGSDAVSGTFANTTANVYTAGSNVFLVNYTDNGDGGLTFNDISLTVTAIPEPGTWLAGALAVGASFTQRRRLLRAISRRSTAPAGRGG